MAAAGGGAGRAAGAAAGAGAGAGAAALGAGAGAGAGAAALGAGAAAAGAGAGAGAGAALGGTMAPSQPAAAVAGVQVASRQHSSLVPFFQAWPAPLRQLSSDCALAAVAKAAEANTIATLFNFFMVLLMGNKSADILREKIRNE